MNSEDETYLDLTKRRTGSRLGNPVLITEAKVTLINAGLAATLLADLLLDAALKLKAVRRE